MQYIATQSYGTVTTVHLITILEALLHPSGCVSNMHVHMYVHANTSTQTQKQGKKGRHAQQTSREMPQGN